jgi:hypothetical protein
MRRHLLRARARSLLLAGSIDACLKQKRLSQEEVRERSCRRNTNSQAVSGSGRPANTQCAARRRHGEGRGALSFLGREVIP